MSHRKCNFESEKGRCLHRESPNYRKMCPRFKVGADIDDCDLACEESTTACTGCGICEVGGCCTK